MFDLKNPALERGMPYTCVVERPDLQNILLDKLPEGVVRNAAGVQTYTQHEGGVTIELEDGEKVIHPCVRPAPWSLPLPPD